MSCSCPNCGHDLPADYKRVPVYAKEIRINMLKAMTLLAASIRPMTVNELAQHFPEERDRIEIKRHFQELRLWRFLQKEGTTYRVTEHGRNFLRGIVQVPLIVFTRDNEPCARPDDAEEPPMVYVYELDPGSLPKPLAAPPISPLPLQSAIPMA